MHIRTLRKRFEANKTRFRRFISRLESATHRGILPVAREAEAEVWQEVNCLQCANCCRKMTPTLNGADKQRIAEHLGLSVKEFTNKYLEYNKEERDWRMQKQPCVFLDLQTNMCTIYDVRPKDCAGFPHLTRTPLSNYMHVHKQNIEYCPATYLFVEKMMDRIEITNR